MPEHGGGMLMGEEEGGGEVAEQWVEFSSSLEPPEVRGGCSGVTSLAFDPSCELLWSGYDSGRVTATFFPGSSVDSTPEQERNMLAYQRRDGWASKYCSFRAFDSAVLEVLPLSSRVLALSRDSARIHSRGGLPYCSFKPLSLAGGAGNSAISCGATFQPSGGLMRGVDENYLFLGTSSPTSDGALPCPVFDLQNPGVGPLVSIDTGGISTRCVEACPAAASFLYLGGADGKIRLVDPSLRSTTVQHTLDAHSGGVRSLSVTADGTALLSSGYTARPVNPYDPQSPVTVHPDPLLRVFDMRMLRQAPPLSLTIPGAPVAARFLPTGGGDGNSPGPSFLAATGDGTMQSLSLQAATLEQDMGALPEVLYASLLGVPVQQDPVGQRPQPDQISCLAVAPSSRVIAAGSSLGSLSLSALVENPNSGVQVQVHQNPTPMVVPPLIAPPPGGPSLPPDGGPSPGTSRLLSKSNLTSLEATRLLSSFHTTPAVCKRPLRLAARQKILPSTLALASFQDDHFLGTIKYQDLVEQHNHSNKANSGQNSQTPDKKSAPLFPPNSMLCAKAKGVGYAVCDPRVAMVAAGQRNAPRQPVKREASPHLSPTVALSLSCSPVDSGTFLPPASHQTESGHQDMPPPDGTGVVAGGKKAYKQHHPPTAYRKMKSHRGRHRMQAFNYRAYNTTPFVGLENSTPNSWNNPMLQVLFAIPSIREAALLTQTSTYHHSRNPTSLLGELGFLFDMMLSICSSSSAWNDVANVATAGNFQRVFQCLPEANATGLFMLEASSSSPRGSSAQGEGSGESEKEAEKLQRNVQVFTRFLLQLISKEIEEESKFTDDSKRSSASREDASKKRVQSVVDVTFGHELSVSTTFLVSNTTSSSALDMSSSVLEMVYPAMSQSSSAPSFASVLWHSCSQTSFQRGGWCASSDSYEPFRQTRSLNLDSIGDFLVLLCGDTMRRGGAKKDTWTPGGLWREKNQKGGAWLPLSVECMFIPGEGGGSLYVSELQSSDDGCSWLIFNGTEVTYSDEPASVAIGQGGDSRGAVITRLKLFAVVSGIMTDLGDGTPGHAHSVLHMCTKTQASVTSDCCDDEWTLFNDFAVMKCSSTDATNFKDWRFPCTLFFVKDSCGKGKGKETKAIAAPAPGWPLDEDGSTSSLEASLALSSSATRKVSVPASVLSLPTLSSKNPVPATSIEQLKAKHNVSGGDDDNGQVLVAFDAEFVSVSVDQVQLDNRGERVVKDEARQVLARISLLDGGSSALEEGKVNDEEDDEKPKDHGSSQSSVGATEGSTTSKSNAVVLTDDYVLPSEVVVDYVTRFSGLVAEDLDPVRSRHAVVSPRTAYLKLRYYLDAGCVFVGHGLQKDFETANIFVSPEHVRDTVELWRLPHQRKISLRFLAYYLLKMEIQDDLHDSIEDSWTALLLYRHYLTVKAKGYKHFHGVLTELYAFGSKTNWTIGLDRLSSSSAVPVTGPSSGNNQNSSSSGAGAQYKYSPPTTQSSHPTSPPQLRYGHDMDDAGNKHSNGARLVDSGHHLPQEQGRGHIPLHPSQSGGMGHMHRDDASSRSSGIARGGMGVGGGGYPVEYQPQRAQPQHHLQQHQQHHPQHQQRQLRGHPQNQQAPPRQFPHQHQQAPHNYRY